MAAKTLQEAFDELHEDAVERLLREDAARVGMKWSDYCYRYGIMGVAQLKRIRRHDIQYDTDTLADESEDDE